MAANTQFAMAIHVLAMLAGSGSDYVKSDHIAHSVNTNPVVIRRLLRALAAAGLVSSQTGASGGTRLSRRSAEIDLADVYRAVACGEIFALHGRSPNQECSIGRHIESILCDLQKKMDSSISQTLSEYTLEDVVGMIGADS
jgi:Rrf2 family protein